MDTGLVIKKQYVRKHLFMMVVEQLLDDYRKEGYEIKTQYPISGTLRADLFAVRGEERIVIELVFGRTPADVLNQLKQTVNAEGFTLKVIDVSKVTFEQ
jgi:hypothetical protein